MFNIEKERGFLGLLRKVFGVYVLGKFCFRNFIWFFRVRYGLFMDCLGVFFLLEKRNLELWVLLFLWVLYRIGVCFWLSGWSRGVWGGGFFFGSYWFSCCYFCFRLVYFIFYFSDSRFVVESFFIMENNLGFVRFFCRL